MNTIEATCVICGMPFEARTSYGLCPLCWQKDRLREFDRLQSATRQAHRLRVAVRLTLVQWLSTVSDFDGLCAYCQEVPYYFIDMVVQDKGLTYENVVPICRSCAIHKRSSFEGAKKRVVAYLSGQCKDRTYLEKPRSSFAALLAECEEVEL